MSSVAAEEPRRQWQGLRGQAAEFVGTQAPPGWVAITAPEMRDPADPDPYGDVQLRLDWRSHIPEKYLPPPEDVAPLADPPILRQAPPPVTPRRRGRGRALGWGTVLVLLVLLAVVGTDRLTSRRPVVFRSAPDAPAPAPTPAPATAPREIGPTATLPPVPTVAPPTVSPLAVLPPATATAGLVPPTALPPRLHQVQAGETLSSIAAAVGRSPAEVLAVNLAVLPFPDRLPVGITLVLPAPGPVDAGALLQARTRLLPTALVAAAPPTNTPLPTATRPPGPPATATAPVPVVYRDVPTAVPAWMLAPIGYTSAADLLRRAAVTPTVMEAP